jgi:hypothetical protein
VSANLGYPLQSGQSAFGQIPPPSSPTPRPSSVAEGRPHHFGGRESRVAASSPKPRPVARTARRNRPLRSAARPHGRPTDERLHFRLPTALGAGRASRDGGATLAGGGARHRLGPALGGSISTSICWSQTCWPACSEPERILRAKPAARHPRPRLRPLGRMAARAGGRESRPEHASPRPSTAAQTFHRRTPFSPCPDYAIHTNVNV